MWKTMEKPSFPLNISIFLLITMILKQSWQFINLFSLLCTESWYYKECLNICPLWNYSDFWQVAQDTETGKLTHISRCTNIFHIKINLDILYRGKTRPQILSSLWGFTTIISLQQNSRNLKPQLADTTQPSGRTPVCSEFIQIPDPPVLNPSAV